MEKRSLISCLALICTLSLAAFTVVDDPFASLLKKLEEFSKKYPTEKVHVHLDKPYYAIGDDIWFKVYTIDSRTSAPTTLSKIVYVELIDENDSLRTQLKLPLQGGITWGDLKLPDTLSEGNYRIRAYTQLMRNAGPDFFFDKTLNVGRRSADDKRKVTKTIPTTIDVQFFPESGNLLQGMSSRVAFKAVNAQGKGEDSEGAIIDGDGAEITTFESTHLGMGSFFLNPVAGKTYRAKIKFKNGSEKLFDLPKTESSGYVLSVNSLDTTRVGLRVLATDDLIAKGDLNLLAQQNGRVYFAIKIPMAKNLAITTLPRSELPSGIITLTLLNAANIPVAERLIFNESYNGKIKIDVGNMEEEYSIRGAMNLELFGTNKDKPTQGSFSISVTNATAVEPDPENETNILSSLLLTSDLRGYIERPNYYFMENGVKGRQDLDHLLLTQGWRKIDWKAMDGAVPLTMAGFGPETETELKISGTITNNSGKPVQNGRVSLFSSSGGTFNIDTLTDANGRFNFDGLQFTDSARFVIQARNEKGKREVRIKLDVVPTQLVTANKNTGYIEVDVNKRLENYLQNSNVFSDKLTKKGMLNQTMQLKKVDIVGEKKKVEYSSNLNGPGNADFIITAKDLENAQQLSRYMAGRIVGIRIGTDSTGYGRRAYGRSSEPMSIVVDGMQMDSTFYMDDVNASHIESVEVLKNVGFSAIYGSRAAGGVLVITTKRGGNSTVSNYTPGIVTYNPKGFAVSRQFYSPRYDTAPDLKPDRRTTVYWNPSIVSDEKGKFKLDYFNTDEAGLYRVVIEGIDVMGNLARRTFTYQVK